MVISNMRLWSPGERSGPDIQTWEYWFSNGSLVETIKMEEITQKESIMLFHYCKENEVSEQNLETAKVYWSSKQTRECFFCFAMYLELWELISYLLKGKSFLLLFLRHVIFVFLISCGILSTNLTQNCGWVLKQMYCSIKYSKTIFSSNDLSQNKTFMKFMYLRYFEDYIQCWEL